MQAAAGFLILLAIVLPILLAVFVVAAKNDRIVRLVYGTNGWFEITYGRLTTSGSSWQKYLVRPWVWPFKKLGDWTASANNRYWMSAVRIFGWGYTALIVLFVAATLAYAVAILILAVAVMAFALVVVSSSEDEKDAKETRISKSYERDGLFGKYTEHYDDDGNKIGESRERDGFFGQYIEHTDAAGNKIGESRDRDGFFGPYTEHSNASGTKTGESRDGEGFFGPYREHTDRSGHKTGESRQREGLFGSRTEHSGTGSRGEEGGKSGG